MAIHIPGEVPFQFSATNPHRYSDGSFKFTVFVHPPEQRPSVVASAQVEGLTRTTIIMLAQALLEVAKQLPEIEIPGHN